MSAHLRLVAPDDVLDERGQEQHPLIAPGNYRAIFVRSWLVQMRMHGGGCWKIVVAFRVVDAGDAYGVIVRRFFRVQRAPGTAQGFKVSRYSDLYRTLCWLRPEKLRLDRLNAKELFRGRIALIRVRTVTSTRAGGRTRALPPSMHWSVIDDVLSFET